MTWSLALGYFSGLYWIAPELDPGTLVRTVVVMHICDAVVCSVIARNHHYSKRLCSALGLLFGIWAVAILLLRASADSAAPNQGGTTGG